MGQSPAAMMITAPRHAGSEINSQRVETAQLPDLSGNGSQLIIIQKPIFGGEDER